MEDILIYPAGSTAACSHCAKHLKKQGIHLIDHPSPEVTHLLLDVPSLKSGTMLRGGGHLEDILAMLPESITIIGGNLSHPALEGYPMLDLLKNEFYLAENAAITADCAMQAAAQEMETVFRGCPVLIIGWGRIGKCLGQLLKAVGAEVAVAARKERDRAMLQALGYTALDLDAAKACISKFRLLFNTAPEMLFSETDLSGCQDCVKIDLASKPGISGSGVIWARGLPGIHAPESSGRLMAQTILHLLGRD